MTINELNSYYNSLIENITNDNNTIDRMGLLNYVLPSLNMARLIDSEEISFSFYQLEKENVEIDGYLFNDTQERLQIFLSNLLLPGNENLYVSRKEYYDLLFAKTRNFVNKSIKGYLKGVQAGDPASVLIKFLESPTAIAQIDVIEIFIITNSVSIESRGNQQSLKNFVFSDDELPIKYSDGKNLISRKLKIKYQLIDLNKIYNFEMSEGNSEPIIINFSPPLPAIKAADDEKVFESYLAVIPAKLLYSFYSDYSSRLLERNVRSFLQFKGVNKALKETLEREPEKFIAYNNGLTITCTSSSIDTINGVSMINSLTDFQIVNGGQTTASIYFSGRDGVDISNVNVIAKINIIKSENREDLDDLISKISEYSNSQSRVSAVDLNSRSVYLVKIKNLSESITDPKGQKWFFERVRGEFNTMVRIASKQKSQIEKNYPKSKRLSKEQLAKYYVAWGLSPFLVRKGGEKVFRDFMRLIKLDASDKPIDPENLGRAFYEDLIAKAIIFKELEKLYGSGPNSIGQIRSSVVPYTMSILYRLSQVKKSNRFDLGKIWLEQELPEDIKAFCYNLLIRVHELCKRYSKSDDVGEYAKREELWNAILNSKEYELFEKDLITKDIVGKYILNDGDFKKRYQSSKIFDFTNLTESARIHGNGNVYYTRLKLEFDSNLTMNEKVKFEQISQKIQVKHNLTKELIEFEKEKLRKLQELNPDWFLTDRGQTERNLLEAVNFVMVIYNKNNQRVKEAFEAESLKALKKGFDQQISNALKNTGVLIEGNKEPLMKDIYKIADLIK